VAAGCTPGIVPHLLAATVGLSGAMQASATLSEVVRWVGVAYLILMGVSMIRSGGALQLGVDTDAVDQRTLAVVRRGILLNVLNPKLTIFFFAFLPQFLDGTPQLFDAQMVLLGLVFMAMTLVVFVRYAYMSATVRDRVLNSPGLVRWIQRSLGADAGRVRSTAGSGRSMTLTFSYAPGSMPSTTTLTSTSGRAT